MKKNLLLLLLFVFCLSGFAQDRVVLSPEFRTKSKQVTSTTKESKNQALKEVSSGTSKEVEYEVIGNTFFDLQSNYSMQNRIFKYPDNTIGGIWTMGNNNPSFADRGTGYNYFDGSEWGPYPIERIEAERAGWPSYAPWGTNGEIVVAHFSGASQDGLVISSRPNKGTGAWSYTNFPGPSTNNFYLWPRAMTGGSNYNSLHVIALTAPVANGGTIYQGMNGALLYSRSDDGGNSWEVENLLISDINSNHYVGFGGDTYDIQSFGDNVAFLVGSNWTDLVLMKSADNGDTWEKTIIWEHPYPMYDPEMPFETDTFYCVDGAHSLAFDNSGKVHVAFGINRTYDDGTGSAYWFPGVGGIGYWNEDMIPFSNNMNALNPYGGPGSEMIEDYNLIGWSQDINGNGELELLDDWGAYYLGLSSMPQLVIDESNNIFLVYSAVTELYDNGIQNYRHLWARGYSQASQSWGIFRDLTADLYFIFSECVFPSCSPTSDDKIHLVFQEDNEPGLAVRGDEDPFGENHIRYLNVDKSDLITIVNGNGHLSGTVTIFGNGNPLSGATISIQGTSYTTTSNANGTYTINDIPIGIYTAVCSKNGFVTEYESIEIFEDITTIQNFQLEDISTPPEGIIGNTYYDLQSNSSMQNRIYYYPDGTIGSAWTFGLDFPNFTDRGTGYNYFDGIDWAPVPVERIENDRTGWPSYTPWGLNGEIIVAHYSGASSDGLIINSRENKGSGDWFVSEFFGPTSNNYYLWPRAMAGGSDHNDLHLIAITAPVANGGSTYQGMDGALLYSRSPDGGLTWDHEHILLDEINSNFYNGFDGDSYEIQTQGENVAFLVGDAWTDLVLMKSTDNGDSWTKTIIWEHPYPLWSGIPTDTFYCVDGAHSLAFDLGGKVHVAFGINRAISDDGITQSWFPAVDGIGYWNEDMPTFSNDLNALNPYGGPGTELIEDYNLIGWTQDINGNGVLDILDDWGAYYLGFSSMPQLVIDETNCIYLVYSSVTETYDNGSQNYRHLWARGSNDNGQTWGNFVHLTQDLIYIFSESVFPSLSPNSDNDLHLVFMEDYEPGMAVRGDEDPYGENHIVYMSIPKTDIVIPAPGGTLEGIVTDASTGFGIENAMVSLEGTNLTTNTNENGYYILLNIPPGNYFALCSKMGYLNGEADVLIEENSTSTQDFELEEAIGLLPPDNLSASVFDLNNVSLSWDAPASGTVNGYNVYRNNTIIEFVTLTETLDSGVDPGTHIYYVTAVYETGESEASNSVEVSIAEPLEPPVNVMAFVNSDDVTLSWDPPNGSGSEGEWIQWDDGTNNGNGIGVTSGGIFSVASRWEPADLAEYDGMKITQLSFFANGDPDAIYELKIWSGPNAGTLILSQEISSFSVDMFNEIDLLNPVLIDASMELWFGYEVSHEINMFPAGCDDGPAIPFKGDMISMDGNNWESLSTSYPALDYNWNLAAYVEELDGEMIVNKPLAPPTPYSNQNTGLSAVPVNELKKEVKVFNPGNVKDLLYYNIYRDTYLIGNTTATSYLDLDLPPGTYEYCITAVYDEGESDCSETVNATISEPCFPPENVMATLYNITEVEVTWEPPSAGTVMGYNIYVNGLLYDFTTSTSIYFNSLGSGTYEFCIVSICASGGSEPACTDPVSITLLPPSNLEAEISGSNILLSWDAPENKSLVGYNVFHQYETGNFEMFAYVTQTSSVYSDPDIGHHNFYVVSVYDEGVSNPSNTVEVLITTINNMWANEITIHPNPASDFMYIEADDVIISLEVFSHKGQKLKKEKINNKTCKFSTSQYSPGLYFFQIITNEGTITKRVIIE